MYHRINNMPPTFGMSIGPTSFSFALPIAAVSFSFALIPSTSHKILARNCNFCYAWVMNQPSIFADMLLSCRMRDCIWYTRALAKLNILRSTKTTIKLARYGLEHRLSTKDVEEGQRPRKHNDLEQGIIDKM